MDPLEYACKHRLSGAVLQQEPMLRKGVTIHWEQVGISVKSTCHNSELVSSLEDHVSHHQSDRSPSRSLVTATGYRRRGGESV